ncbi:FUSC family protein [Parasporobacterium paucivorans]|uniref:Fusaric acid resistance protein-like n=1 Tax=Parasporobacterium paucivorans DSM 15970 TaxID=1122934 RepID=A0A1M6KTS0_9FIRM|nr:FUSC family protein [Parasporobacterium paucivorans]SHJ62365.1 Fusaric acid resistance protein-like [Parasporobacterium paucivorans DSM 15970]
MEKTIKYRMLSSFLTCAFLCAICLLGVLSKDVMILIPFLYAGINFVSYIFWMKTEMAFPFYFHIGMTYLILSNTESLSVYEWLILWCGITVIIVVTFLLIGVKKHESFGKDSAINMIIKKYKTSIHNNQLRIKRAAMHSIVLFIISWSEYLVHDYKGFWIMISAGAVMIGEDYGKIQTRGLRRIVGAFLGFAIGGVLLILGAGKIALISCYIIALIISCFAMPKKYILGSACIGLEAVSGNALAEGTLSSALIVERLIWTIVGAALAIGFCVICDKIIKNIYEDKSRDKIIARYDKK